MHGRGFVKAHPLHATLELAPWLSYIEYELPSLFAPGVAVLENSLVRLLRTKTGYAVACIAISSVISVGFADTASAQGVENADPTEPEQRDNTSDEPVWLGVQIGDRDDDERGAPITRILDDSPASRADLASGDQISKVDGRAVDDLDSLRRALDAYEPGDEITVTLRRDGTKLEREVVLSTRPSRRTLIRNQLVGTMIPSVKLQSVTTKSKTLSRSDVTGKPLVLEFWATWCYPCRITAETLTALQSEFGDQIRIVGISREDRGTLKEFAQQNEPAYELVRDVGGEAHDHLLVSSYPTVVVANAKGEVVEIFLGKGHGEELRATLEKLLE